MLANLRAQRSWPASGPDVTVALLILGVWLLTVWFVLGLCCAASRADSKTLVEVSGASADADGQTGTSPARLAMVLPPGS